MVVAHRRIREFRSPTAYAIYEGGVRPLYRRCAARIGQNVITVPEVATDMSSRAKKEICVFSVVEALLVGVVLVLATVWSGGSSADWLSCVAVFLTFFHSQAAFNLADKLVEKDLPQRGAVDASKLHTGLFLVKEAFWVMTFLALGSYPLLVSSFLLSTYPLWRGKIRSLKVLELRRERSSAGMVSFSASSMAR